MLRISEIVSRRAAAPLASIAFVLLPACADVDLPSTAPPEQLDEPHIEEVTDDPPARGPASLLGTQNGPRAYWRITTGLSDAAGLDAALSGHLSAGHDIDAVASTATGEWVVVAAGSQSYSAGFPLAIRLAIAQRLAAGDVVRAVDVNPAGGWVVVGTSTYHSGGALPPGVLSQLDWYQATQGYVVRDLEITNTGYVIVGPGSTASYSSIDADLADAIYDRRASGRRIAAVEIGQDGRWAVVADQAAMYEGVSSTLESRLRTSAQSGVAVSRLHLGVGASYVVVSHGAVAPDLARDEERLEYDVGNAGDNVWARMAAAGVPGLQIALVSNHRVQSVRSYGVLRASQQRPVLATTPFDLASLSKFLGALAIVRAWAQGDVDLDADLLNAPGARVGTWESLGSSQPNANTSYGIPDLPLPTGMTLRRLLTHRAGLRAEGGSPGVPAANWGLLPVGMAAQLLGYTCSSAGSPCAFTKSKYVWTDGSAPGGAPVYASGNNVLAQAVLEDATGVSGAAHLQDLFTTLGLSNSSGAAPLPAALEARAAWQHGGAGAEASSRTVYPWTFAGGVYASAGDYARLMILALTEGRDEDGVQRIPSGFLAQMLAGGFSRGLGVMLEGGNTAAEGSDRPFWHNGAHGSRALTWMCGNPTRGEGIVLLANANSPESNALLTDLLDTYVAARGWPAGLNCR